MKRVGKFEKVSFEQFSKDWTDAMFGGASWTEEVYKSIKLPERATKFSAGYDFYSPLQFTLKSGCSVKIPTGIRCLMNTDCFLSIYPRSSLGFKHQIGLANTVAIIDADYSNSDNEGHIFIKLVNNGDHDVLIERGEAIVQGIFMEYCITEDDKVEATRNGGIGSTNKEDN